MQRTASTSCGGHRRYRGGSQHTAHPARPDGVTAADSLINPRQLATAPPNFRQAQLELESVVRSLGMDADRHRQRDARNTKHSASTTPSAPRPLLYRACALPNLDRAPAIRRRSARVVSEGMGIPAVHGTEGTHGPASPSAPIAVLRRRQGQRDTAPTRCIAAREEQRHHRQR